MKLTRTQARVLEYLHHHERASVHRLAAQLRRSHLAMRRALLDLYRAGRVDYNFETFEWTKVPRKLKGSAARGYPSESCEHPDGGGR